MEAVNPINPSALFLIKGADQTIYTTNGGQGFVTDQQLITAAQCSNPNAFFRSLLSKSYSTQVWSCIHLANNPTQTLPPACHSNALPSCCLTVYFERLQQTWLHSVLTVLSTAADYLYAYIT